MSSKKHDCPSHDLWVVCEDILNGNVNEVWLHPDRIAVCSFCGETDPDNIKEDDLHVLCSECLKKKLVGIEIILGLEYLEKSRLC